MFHGRWPTGIVAVKVWLATSNTDTLASPPFETNTRLPSGWTVTPLLRMPAGTFADVLVTYAAPHFLKGSLVGVTARPRHRTRIPVMAVGS